MRYLVILLLAGMAFAQTVSPVISECGLRCRGSFSVHNNGTLPLLTTIDVHSFKVENGKTILLPLDNGTKIEIDSTSVRLSPLGDHEFFYKVFCDVEPCLTQFVASFQTKQHDGINVVTHIPHVIYSCKTQKNCRKRTLGGH
jgi:hypothetical protein